MDRLISEQAVLDILKNGKKYGEHYYSMSQLIEIIKAIPSAYKGMTNMEVIKMLFPDPNKIDGEFIFTKEWGDRPYEPKTDDMTSSHSELDIYKGCIDLMNDLLRQVYEWLEIVGIDISEMDEDEKFATHFYTTEIVERLFLWKTSHSGGTSQRMKLKELGITDDAVLFDFAKMVEPQESEE